MALTELALFVVPIVMLASPSRRGDLGHLLRTSMVMMAAGALYRLDTYLVAFMPGAHWVYFPSVTELLITVGLVAIEIIAYIVIVKLFPILAGSGPRLERQAAA
jgi:Ni/Fe-hydrogenase subunit HybB-like protein